jgi:hypothetical protein
VRMQALYEAVFVPARVANAGVAGLVPVQARFWLDWGCYRVLDVIGRCCPRL